MPNINDVDAIVAANVGENKNLGGNSNIFAEKNLENQVT